MPAYALRAIVALTALACDVRAPIRQSGTEAHLVTGTAVRVRSAPSLDAPIVGKLRLGTTVVVPLAEQPRDTS